MLVWVVQQAASSCYTNFRGQRYSEALQTKTSRTRSWLTFANGSCARQASKTASDTCTFEHQPWNANLQHEVCTGERAAASSRCRPAARMPIMGAYNRDQGQGCSPGSYLVAQLIRVPLVHRLRSEQKGVRHFEPPLCQLKQAPGGTESSWLAIPSRQVRTDVRNNVPTGRWREKPMSVRCWFLWSAEVLVPRSNPTEVKGLLPALTCWHMHANHRQARMQASSNALNRRNGQTRAEKLVRTLDGVARVHS